MALLAIQLLRVVLFILPGQSLPVPNVVNLVIGINEMFTLIKFERTSDWPHFEKRFKFLDGIVVFSIALKSK